MLQIHSLSERSFNVHKEAKFLSTFDITFLNYIFSFKRYYKSNIWTSISTPFVNAPSGNPEKITIKHVPTGKPILDDTH